LPDLVRSGVSGITVIQWVTGNKIYTGEENV